MGWIPAAASALFFNSLYHFDFDKPGAHDNLQSLATAVVAVGLVLLYGVLRKRRSIEDKL